MNKFVAVVAALGAAAFSTVAAVGPAWAAPVDTYSVEVGHGDLDLTRSDHRRELDRRLRRASVDVCHRANPGIRGSSALSRCQSKALVAARANARAARALAEPAAN